MSENFNHQKKSNGLPHAEFINAARHLRSLHDRDAFLRLVIVALVTLFMLGVSGLLSLVTGGVLTRVMGLVPAYMLGAFIHLAIAVAVHLGVVGVEQRDRRDKIMALVFMGFGLTALFYVFCARAFALMAEGRSFWFAWMVSTFLLMLEIVVPALLGYILGKMWLAWRAAADEARFYRQHDHLIETSQQPQQRWHDAEDRQEEEIEELEGGEDTATPEELADIKASVKCLKRRARTLREWNPTRAFKRSGASRESALSPVGGNGRKNAPDVNILVPLPPAYPDSGEDVPLYG